MSDVLSSMPCSNIDETIEIQIDAGDRVQGYALAKSTCGAPVMDESLLLNVLQGQSVADVLAMPMPTEFSARKHLSAVQALLRFADGRDVNFPGITFTGITFDDGVMLVRGVVHINIGTQTELRDAIPPCAGCG